MTHAPTLSTERLVLRSLVPADVAPAVTFFASDRSVHVGGPRPEREAWRFVAMLLGHWQLHGFGMWAIAPRSAPEPAIGVVGFYAPLGWPEREIGWHMWDPAHEGRGLMTEAARFVQDYAFRVLRWETLVSYIRPDNARSIALAARLGAIYDDTAARPEGPDCLVYRHPAPVAA